jgi:hypothetical protein
LLNDPEGVLQRIVMTAKQPSSLIPLPGTQGEGSRAYLVPSPSADGEGSREAAGEGC